MTSLSLAFVCLHCHHFVPCAKPAHGHCPVCLWSRHVGFGIPALDRLTQPCGGMMEPLRVSKHKALGKVIWLRCECGYELSGMPVKRDSDPSSGWAQTMRVWVPGRMTSPQTFKTLLGPS